MYRIQAGCRSGEGRVIYGARLMNASGINNLKDRNKMEKGVCLSLHRPYGCLCLNTGMSVSTVGRVPILIMTLVDAEDLHHHHLNKELKNEVSEFDRDSNYLINTTY